MAIAKLKLLKINFDILLGFVLVVHINRYVAAADELFKNFIIGVGGRVIKVNAFQRFGEVAIFKSD